MGNDGGITNAGNGSDAQGRVTLRFDVVIIGAGPGGYSTALRAAELGRTVALVERDATLGGTCLNRGCIPSKALITATHAIDTVRRAGELGVNATIDGIDYGRLRDYRLNTVDVMTKGLAGLLAHRRVVVFRGVASLGAGTGAAGAPVVHVAPSPGLDAVLRSDKAGAAHEVAPEVDLVGGDVVVATGSAPKPLPGEPFRGSVMDSTAALELDEFPSSAVIIGAGAIALEFASMWSQAGTKVTLLIRKDRVLSAWDRRTGMTLTRELRRKGVDVVAHTAVSRIETSVNPGATVHYMVAGEDGERTVWADTALVAIGRVPATGDDWFAAAGLTLNPDGLVPTDPWGRTAVPHVWALGDITPGNALAHRAFEQGITVAEAIAGLDPKPVDETTIPRVVFTSPEAASVGLTADEAQARDGIANVTETAFPMLSNARMLMSGQTGSLQVVCGEYDDRPGVPVVLGVHIVSPIASDMIAEAEQLVGNRVPLSDAARLVHPHPTFVETLGEALLKADGRPLHTR